MHGKRLLLAATLAPLLAGAAGAATFQIGLAGQTTTFTAPAGGGSVSELVLTLGEVVFDTPLGGGSTPTYDPVDNDINGPGNGLFGYMTNAAGTGTCAAGDCLLEFEDAEADAPPKLWAAFSEVDGVFDAFLGSGEYVIETAGGRPDSPGDFAPNPPAPVPAPAAGGLLALALGLIGLGRWRRRRA